MDEQSLNKTSLLTMFLILVVILGVFGMDYKIMGFGVGLLVLAIFNYIAWGKTHSETVQTITLITAILLSIAGAVFILIGLS